MKKELLNLLSENKEKYISGEKISEHFGISRTAIWKYIKVLKSEGYIIESSAGKGYRLIDRPDILTENEIMPLLSTTFIGKKIFHFEELDSTNKKAKEISADEVIDGAVVVSELQTSGKGRLGRLWVSPKGKGIWMSLILSPQIPPNTASKITIIAAAAVQQALTESGITSQIKWPNDIILSSKKICGILTEMSAELERINYIVLGIGINVHSTKEDITPELQNKATSIYLETGRQISRKDLMASVLNHFEPLYLDFIQNNTIEKCIEICRRHSAVINKKVFLLEGAKKREVLVKDISENGMLIIEDNGKIEKIISGEVSIRGLDSYI